MKNALLALVSIILVACGNGAALGESRQFDDASVAAGGTSGRGGATTTDAGSSGGATADAGYCSGGPVSNVQQARAPFGPSLQPQGASWDGGIVILPTDPCGGLARDCTTAPRSVFGCPVVAGPGGDGEVAPGDAITVTVPVTDEGLDAYSCMGIVHDTGALEDGSTLFYGVKPGYVQESGRIPASAEHGAVIHFHAGASGPGDTACSNDLVTLAFDVTVK